MENNSTSIFPSQHDDELPINISPGFSIWDVGTDHILHHHDSPKLEGIYENYNLPEKLQETEDGSANQDVQKKLLHREIERRRRTEMADLYASLRSVLPPQYLKGKRSVSDQIDEATKHIRYLQNNMRQLQLKRANIKRLCGNELLSPEKGSSSKSSPLVVTVQLCSVGVEVLISGESMAEGKTLLPLSRILQLLLEEGLDVVHCNCAKIDGRLHSMIQSEVRNYPRANLQMLQRKLICMISNSTGIKQ